MAEKTVYTFRNLLGFDGKKADEEKALAVLDEIGVNAENDIGETPLIVAAYLGRPNILKIIIPKINNIDYKNPEKITETALLMACDQRRLECIKLLVEAGANLEQEDKRGFTPLAKIFTNVFSDPIPCANYLVSKGAKITDRVIKIGKLWNEKKFNDFLNNLNNIN